VRRDHLKIQLALDRLTKKECCQILDQTKDSIDIIEVGTGVIKEYGMSIVKEIKEKYSALTLLADMKTCDAGRSEALQAFRSDADIMTVMAFSANQTIMDTLSIAREYEKRVMIDLLGIQTRDRVKELFYLGCDLFCIHLGKDMQQHETLDINELLKLVDGLDVDVAIAGGVDAIMIQEIKQLPIDIAIVGSAITSSKNPKIASAEIKDLI